MYFGTAEMMGELVALRKSGLSVKELAVRFGCSARAVEDALSELKAAGVYLPRPTMKAAAMRYAESQGGKR